MSLSTISYCCNNLSYYICIHHLLIVIIFTNAMFFIFFIFYQLLHLTNWHFSVVFQRFIFIIVFLSFFIFSSFYIFFSFSSFFSFWVALVISHHIRRDTIRCNLLFGTRHNSARHNSASDIFRR